MAYYDFEAKDSQNLITMREANDKKNKILFFHALTDTHNGISVDVCCCGENRYFWGKWSNNRYWSRTTDTEDRFTNTILTLAHEINHQLNAPDHYHNTKRVGDTIICSSGNLCSDCSHDIQKRSKECIMYKSVIDIFNGNFVCKECLNDILDDMTHHKI